MRITIFYEEDHYSSHKVSQKLPICYYDNKLRHASIEHGGHGENQPERREHEEKQ